MPVMPSSVRTRTRKASWVPSARVVSTWSRRRTIGSTSTIFMAIPPPAGGPPAALPVGTVGGARVGQLPHDEPEGVEQQRGEGGDGVLALEAAGAEQAQRLLHHPEPGGAAGGAGGDQAGDAGVVQQQPAQLL